MKSDTKPKHRRPRLQADEEEVEDPVFERSARSAADNLVALKPPLD
jgi:hypothetical protein